ncbi:cytochrome P450 [Hygrophoropsis aurantiaca]|uniref:Cytochrome P450 n=1 Tax=Hygrophoropsis aurantiaca TaxID=72124 RepID=A0ACB8AFL4_9AGAM|nr:cytochrome P450 [Hygrophoropsis aurantiaca]
MLDQPVLVFAVLGAATFLIARYNTKRRANPSGLPFPPGPRPLPFLGNILNLNVFEPWLSYTDWQKTYGDIVYSRLLGQNFIIINSQKVAKELIEQRSTIYSDRPVIATNKLFGMDFNTVLQPYGSLWRHHRKLFHYALRPETTPRYRELYLQKAHTLLLNIFEKEKNYVAHLKGFTASIIMALTYGYQAKPQDDPIVKAVEELVALLTRVLTAERAAVLAAFPALEHVPAWFPGARFKREALYGRKLAARVNDVPFYLVKDELAKGTASPSMVSDLLSQIDENDQTGEQENAIKATAATVFIAGAETSSSTLQSFILAMLLHPEVQAKAQAEIDSAIGTSRLPNFDDRPSLPYVEAILREILRWRPVVPLGIPHATSSDDVYNGYFIPKGSIVIINTWAMGRDERKYSNVDDFNPDRHFTSDGKLAPEPISSNSIFGFGRRQCPGRFVSESFTWAAIASILATFHLSKAKDESGNAIDVKAEYSTGLAIEPLPFPCSFTSRSPERERLICESE